MRRLQLFEFNDLEALPTPFRRFLTEFVRTVVETVRPFHAKADLLVEALRATGETRIVDLCSGGGGPWQQLAPLLRERLDCEPTILLTDKFPTPDAVSPGLARHGVSYRDGPVDAASVPAELAGARTLFDAFHHFPRDRAVEILRDAIRAGTVIAIYDALERSRRGVLLALSTPIVVLLMSPFITPFRWSRLVFTYLLPVAPLLLTWDALVSNLRCYTPLELRTMADEAGGDAYVWQAGTHWKRRFPVTYLVGTPRRSARDGDQEPARLIGPAAT